MITAERLSEVSRVSLRFALSTADLTRRRAELGASNQVDVLRAEQEVARSQSKLANEKFVDNAPEKIVAGEREKLDVNSRMLETLSRRLDEYI